MHKPGYCRIIRFFLNHLTKWILLEIQQGFFFPFFSQLKCNSLLRVNSIHTIHRLILIVSHLNKCTLTMRFMQIVPNGCMFCIKYIKSSFMHLFSIHWEERIKVSLWFRFWFLQIDWPLHYDCLHQPDHQLSSNDQHIQGCSAHQ